jgi:hypothetical protein
MAWPPERRSQAQPTEAAVQPGWRAFLPTLQSAGLLSRGPPFIGTQGAHAHAYVHMSWLCASVGSSLVLVCGFLPGLVLCSV